MEKRVGIIALLQESNTFIARPTTLEHFEQDLLATGEDVRSRLAKAHHEVGGFFAELDQSGIVAVPLFAARAMPYGVMTSATFDKLMSLLERELRQNLPLDGVLVAPHGATVSEQVRDVDGHWLQMVRKSVGPHCPIIGTIDPHANLSQAMVEATDALVAYRTNPHIDQRERGIEAAKLMVATLRGEIVPRQAAVFLPLAINIECQQTDAAPCLPLYEAAEKLRTRSGVVSTSICLGFPYADVPEMGSSVLVVANGNRELAVQGARELAEKLWTARHDFRPRLISVEEAMKLIEQRQLAGKLDRPICLLDMGDNVGGGSPADGTYLAHAVHDRQLPAAFIAICDPTAVALTSHLAIGERLELTIGGKTDQQHGTPLPTAFTILAKSAGKFSESQPRHGGFSQFDQGPTVVGRTDAGLTIMVTSRRMAPFSLEQIRHCGLDPREFKILIAKGVHVPIAAYREVCQEFIRVNTPGVTSADLSAFDFKYRRRPMFPFEIDAQWSPSTDGAIPQSG